jgi:hypothetical protein
MTDTTQLEIDLEKAEYMRVIMLECLDYWHAELTEESHLDFLHSLYALVEAEQAIATRLTLINDPELNPILEALAGPLLAKSAGSISTTEYYIRLKAEVRSMIEEVSGDDLDEPVDM